MRTSGTASPASEDGDVDTSASETARLASGRRTRRRRRRRRESGRGLTGLRDGDGGARGLRRMTSRMSSANFRGLAILAPSSCCRRKMSEAMSSTAEPGDVRLDDAVLVPLEEGGDVQEESRAVVRPQLDDGTRGVELVGHLHARGGKGEHPAPGDARAEVIVRQVRLAADPRHRGRHRVGRVSRRRLGLSVEILRAQHPNAHSAEVRGDAARPLHARVLSLRAASPRS